MTVSNPFVRRLEAYRRLTAAQVSSIEAVTQERTVLAAREDIIHDGDAPRGVKVVMEGWVCRYKQFSDGRRQIVGFLLPGDCCDPHVFLLSQMSQSLSTLTPVTIARISETAMRGMIEDQPDINDALWLEALVNIEIQREWTISLGRRSATERLAHLFCELALRLRTVGLSNGYDYELPVTQADLGDAMGLSSVHVNRTLQMLRATGLVSLKGKKLTIHDEKGLHALAMFDPGYLHLRSEAQTGQ